MTETERALRDDISFMRTLAEEGRQSPFIGGSILLASGLIFGTASLAIWAALRAGLTDYALLHNGIWFGSAALFGVVLTVLLRRLPRPSGSARAAGIAWSGSGFAIFAIVVSAMLLAYRTEAWVIMALLPSVILALYGSCWYVAGAIGRTSWFQAIAFGSWGMAVLSGWLAADGRLLYLVYAVTLYLLMAIPGFVLMRKAQARA